MVPSRSKSDGEGGGEALGSSALVAIRESLRGHSGSSAAAEDRGQRTAVAQQQAESRRELVGSFQVQQQQDTAAVEGSVTVAASSGH